MPRDLLSEILRAWRRMVQASIRQWLIAIFKSAVARRENAYTARSAAWAKKRISAATDPFLGCMRASQGRLGFGEIEPDTAL
jgi:hypothetical protein